jgi:hypothetical protein
MRIIDELEKSWQMNPVRVTGGQALLFADVDLEAKGKA